MKLSTRETGLLDLIPDDRMVSAHDLDKIIRANNMVSEYPSGCLPSLLHRLRKTPYVNYRELKVRGNKTFVYQRVRPNGAMVEGRAAANEREEAQLGTIAAQLGTLTAALTERESALWKLGEEALALAGNIEKNLQEFHKELAALEEFVLATVEDDASESVEALRVQCEGMENELEQLRHERDELLKYKQNIINMSR